MLKGTYHKKINFESFEMKKFTPFLYDPIFNFYGCGYCAASLLTGVFPSKILQLNNKNIHCSDRFLINYLKKNKFKIQPLSLCGVSNTRADIIKNKIHPYYVILAKQLYKKNENSWAIICNNFIFHNFTIYPLKELEFVNRPIMGAYLIKHKNYL